MSEELDFLFGNAKEINLESEDKRQMMKLTDMVKIIFSQGFWMFTISAMGLCVFGLLMLSVFKPDLMPNALDNFETTERVVLGKMQGYCFNQIPWLNDADSCKLWLEQYRKLENYSEFSFKPHYEQIANESFGRRGIHRNWESEAEAAVVNDAEGGE